MRELCPTIQELSETALKSTIAKIRREELDQLLIARLKAEGIDIIAVYENLHKQCLQIDAKLADLGYPRMRAPGENNIGDTVSERELRHPDDLLRRPRDFKNQD